MAKETHAPLLMRAATEIRQLREANAIMAGKLHVLDLVERLLFASPGGNAQVAGRDVVFDLEHTAKDLESDAKEDAAPPPAEVNPVPKAQTETTVRFRPPPSSEAKLSIGVLGTIFAADGIPIL